MGKGSNTTTTQQSGSSSVSPDSNAYQAYLALLNRASGVASTPYQGFTGEETAPINAQQQAGIGNINAQYGTIAGAGTPISAADIQRYQDPYTNQVINATQADFDTQNARAQSQVTGNAAAQGALGGDRVGVAQALTAEGQARAQAPVIAGLRSQGYQQAVNTAENQQRFGLTADQAALQAAQTQVGAGTLQQQTQQAADTQARADYYQQQGYPFQVAQWLAGIDTAVGGSMGSTSTSTGNAQTQGSSPNPWTQALGLGLSAASLFVKDGGRVTGKRAGFAMGGSPYGSIDTWVPTANVNAHAPTAHASLPGAPQVQRQQGLSQDQMKGFGVLAKDLSGPSYGGGNFLTDAYGGSSSSPLEGLTAADYGAGFGGGGRIKRYASGGFADGGSPDDATFDDRFNAAYPNYVPITAGVGASKPAFSDVGPTYDDGQGPVRLTAPEDLDAWRARVDRDNGRSIQKAAADQGEPSPTMVATAPDEVPTLPPEVTAGVSRGRMTASAAPPEGADEALGYAGPPQVRAGLGAPPQATPAASEEQPSGGLLGSLGIHMTPELRQGLLQAGLSMMATTRGGPGSFLAGLGEAGMTGVGAYTKTQEQALKQAQLEREQQIENEKLKMAEESHAQQMGASPLIQGANGQMVVNPAWVKMKQQEADITQRDKWSPAGSLVTSDGSVHPLAMEMNTGQVKDVVTNKPPSPDDKITPKGSKTSISDEDAQAIARRYVVTGDRTQLMGLGVSGDNRSKVNHYIGQVQKDLNVSDEELGQRVAEFEGRKAGQRTLGTMEARMGSAAFEVEGAINLARDVVERVPRTSLMPLNKLIAKYQEGTLNPDQIELMQRLQAIKNTYAAVMARGSNVTTDAARARGDELLSDAYDDKTFKRVFDTMQSEIDMAKNSPEKMRQFYRQRYGANAVAPEGAAPAAGTAITTTAKPTITTKDEYDKLPHGTVFIKNGKEWTKP